MVRWAVSCFAGPAHELLAGGVQDVLAQRQDEAGLFCQGNEFDRADGAALGVVPARQGFGALDVALVVYHGLVVHEEFAAQQALAQVGL